MKFSHSKFPHLELSHLKFSRERVKYANWRSWEIIPKQFSGNMQTHLWKNQNTNNDKLNKSDLLRKTRICKIKIKVSFKALFCSQTKLFASKSIQIRVLKDPVTPLLSESNIFMAPESLSFFGYFTDCNNTEFSRVHCEKAKSAISLPWQKWNIYSGISLSLPIRVFHVSVISRIYPLPTIFKVYLTFFRWMFLCMIVQLKQIPQVIAKLI